MTYSLILIDLQNKLNLEDFFLYMKQHGLFFETIYCSSKKMEVRGHNLKNFVFKQNENPEKILNTITKKCTQENIIVVRNNCF